MSPENKNRSDFAGTISHIDPELVIQKASSPEVLKSIDDVPVIEGMFTDKGAVLLIHDFFKNNSSGEVSKFIEENTNLSVEDIFRATQVDLNNSSDLLSSQNLTRIKRNVIDIYYEGDKLILDPELQQDRDGKVEFVMVKNIKIGELVGESALVRMWKYGALKQLVLPEGNPGKQIEFEMFFCLKNKLTIVLPRNVENENGLLVAQDEGFKLELQEGDAAILPLVPRQIISNNGDFTNQGAKYYTVGPSWDGECGGVSQRPGYWQGQINKIK